MYYLRYTERIKFCSKNENLAGVFTQ